MNPARPRYPAIIICLWRKTAAAWRAYMRRFALLWKEQRQHEPAHAQSFLAQAVNARDHWRRALAKADAMERGEGV